jgi:hypothetical protein
MGWSKETFTQLQEAEYQETEIFQLKNQLIMPVVKNQQASKSKAKKRHGKS